MPAGRHRAVVAIETIGRGVVIDGIEIEVSVAIVVRPCRSDAFVGQVRAGGSCVFGEGAVAVVPVESADAGKTDYVEIEVAIVVVIPPSSVLGQVIAAPGTGGKGSVPVIRIEQVLVELPG